MTLVWNLLCLGDHAFRTDFLNFLGWDNEVKWLGTMWLAFSFFSGPTTCSLGSEVVWVDSLQGTQVAVLLHVVVQDEEDSKHLLGGEGDKVSYDWVPVGCRAGGRDTALWGSRILSVSSRASRALSPDTLPILPPPTSCSRVPLTGTPLLKTGAGGVVRLRWYNPTGCSPGLGVHHADALGLG